MTTAKQTYQRLTRDRNSVLVTAREASRLTIPGLIPQEGASNPHDITEQPYTSLGARGVNNLSAKLLITSFPPERPFFRLDVDQDTADGLGADIGAAQDALAGISRKAMILAEQSTSRTVWMEVFRHLVVAGNVLVYHPDDGTRMRMWRLDQYVVRRNASGDLMEGVIKDTIFPSELDPGVRSAVGLDEGDAEDADHPSTKEEKPVEIYTWIKRNGDQIEHFEEINGTEVPGSRGSVSADSAGWQALRWQAVPGSPYGRSFVTEYAGDLLTNEDANKAILQFAAAAARIIGIVDPNSGIDIEELAAAESGDYITGYADRIKTLQLDKSQDFQTLWQVAAAVDRRLSQAFLLTANTIRNAERVTAEEIRAVAQELEDALGGTYTVLSAEVQRPYAQRLLYILTKTGKAPKLPASIIPVIVTGFNALGQNHETAALRDWLNDLKEVFGPQWVATRLNDTDVAVQLGTGRGVQAAARLVKPQDQVQAEAAQGAVTQAGIAAAPQLAKGAMDAINQGQPAQ